MPPTPGGSQLDSGPPLPPGLSQAPPSSSLASLSGAQGASPSGGAPLQQAVLEKLMAAEAMLQSAAGIMPELAPVVDDVTGRLRAGAGRIIMASAQPQGAQPMMGTPPMMGMGT